MRSSACIVFSPPGQVQLRKVPSPRVEPSQVLVQTLCSGVSPGTELRCLQGLQAGVGMVAHVPGYQAIGRVIEAGPRSGRHVGELVFCGGGAGGYDPLGCFWGAHAQFLAVEGGDAHVLPGDFPVRGGAIGSLIAIAIHGLDAARVTAGERVAVVGLGVLGQLSARVARLRGAEVVAFDRNQARVDTARADGIAARRIDSAHGFAAHRAEVDHPGFDVIVDATGVAAVIPEAAGLARELMPWDAWTARPTRYVIQGSFPGAIQIPYDQAFLKELTIIVPRDRTRGDLARGLELIGSGRLDVARLIGPPVAPDEAPAVYRELGKPDTTRLAAVFDWTSLSV